MLEAMREEESKEEEERIRKVCLKTSRSEVEE